MIRFVLQFINQIIKPLVAAERININFSPPAVVISTYKTKIQKFRYENRISS